MDLDAGVEIEFDEAGLVPIVTQDATTGSVLMLAYADDEAIRATRTTGLAHYHSRSRNELWQKGKTSGNFQRVREIRVDCDADAVLYIVDQDGGACHTGHRSCFYRTLAGTVVEDRVFDPKSVYD